MKAANFVNLFKVRIFVGQLYKSDYLKIETHDFWNCVKNEVEKLICNLRPALKLRLRFISHINVDESSDPATRLSRD